MTACLLLLPLTAHAGSYSGPVYSGGTITDDSGVASVSLFTNFNGRYMGSAIIFSDRSGQPTDFIVTVTGPLTATFTWQPSYPGEPAPASVIVEQSGYASWGEYMNFSSSLTGASDNGLGQSSGYPVSLSSTQYTIQKPADDGSVTVTCSPSAVIGGNNGTIRFMAGLGVSFSAAVSPAIITLTGTTKDSNGGDNILIGQNCIASLDIQNGPSGLTMDTPTWSIPGNVFKSFDIGPNQTTGQATPYPNPDPAALPEIQPEFYWRDGDILGQSQTISVTAPLHYTSGNVVTYVGDVTATKTVKVWSPTEFDDPYGFINPQFGTVGIEGGAVTSNATDPTGNTIGFAMQAAVGTPDLFTNPDPVTKKGTVFGSWAWLQLCQINTYQGGYGTRMATPQLDSAFPYTEGAGTANGVPGNTQAANSTSTVQLYGEFDDSPSTPWSPGDSNLTFNDAFNLYVMYQPPDTGYGVNWVPLELYQWGFSGNIARTLSENIWRPNPPGSLSYNGRQQNPSYPFWTNKYAPKP